MPSETFRNFLRWLGFALLIIPLTASAHIGQGDVAGGFVAGFLHPVSGLDHVVAMIAVGLWGAQLGQPAIWVLPVTFPLVMAFGGVLGGLGIAIPGIETGIALSAIALGTMVMLEARPPLWVAGIMVAIFAIFHGYAHGAELPESANAISYASGFVIATGSLHVIGIVIGMVNRWKSGAYVLRAGGTMIGLIGAYFLFTALREPEVMPAYRTRFLFSLILLASILCASPAEAHGVMVGTNDFIAGVLHPLTALEDALPFLMLGVVTGQNGLRRCEFMFWLFPLAITAGAIAALFVPGIHGTVLFNILSIVALGLLVAWAKNLPMTVLAGLAVFFGLSHGYANGAEINGSIRSALFISGVALTALFLVAYGTVMTDFLLKRKAIWFPVAVRVAGSWSAAIGLLVLSVSQKINLFS